jgi:hypothetical protein
MGRRECLKSICPKGRAGSNPAPGTMYWVAENVRPGSDNGSMYPDQTVATALTLSSCGVLDRENAQICGVSINAIRHWRNGRRRNTSRQDARRTSHCPRCDGDPLEGAAYAYLLGLYLGDGCITLGRRGVYVLQVACCNDWPGPHRCRPGCHVRRAADFERLSQAAARMHLR